jgi:hypothetical protein
MIQIPDPDYQRPEPPNPKLAVMTLVMPLETSLPGDLREKCGADLVAVVKRDV